MLKTKHVPYKYKPSYVHIKLSRVCIGQIYIVNAFTKSYLNMKPQSSYCVRILFAIGYEEEKHSMKLLDYNWRLAQVVCSSQPLNTMLLRFCNWR